MFEREEYPIHECSLCGMKIDNGDAYYVMPDDTTICEDCLFCWSRTYLKSGDCFLDNEY